MKKKDTNKNYHRCETCDHCIPIGEGDHICDETGIPVFVIEDYEPGAKYLWCGGRRYQKGGK
jgi:hypothetical protein|nr:MAG TPA: hypothetical protein [Caudoviricetes sp.]